MRWGVSLGSVFIVCSGVCHCLKLVDLERILEVHLGTIHLGLLLFLVCDESSTLFNFLYNTLSDDR